jgi:hypothetical protein
VQIDPTVEPYESRQDPPFVPQLLLTGSTVFIATALRGMSRSLGVYAQHASSLARLAAEASSNTPTAPRARAVLRDEVLEVWREVAHVSWQESRRAIDEFDARTRPELRDAPQRGRRGHRVVP